MPITVVSQPITVLGPGVGFILHTDFSGPFETGSTWRVELHAHGDETNAAVVITAPLWTTDQHERRVWINADPDGGQSTFYGRYVALETGQLIDAIYQLLAPDGTTVIDSGATDSITWDTDSSGSKLIPAATGGLTTEEAQQLADVHNLVAPPLTTTSGVPLPIDVGDLVVRPALKLLGIDTTVHTLTGSGTLDLPSIFGFNTAWGLVLDVTSAPSGWGRKPGYVDSFNFRIGQFLYLVPSANGEGAMVIEEFRLHLEHFTWVFRETWGSAIAYYIDPPCEVQLRFLTAFTP